MTRLNISEREDLQARVATHIGAKELLPDGTMRCPACGRLDFGPTMTLDALAVYEGGYLPGAPLLAGACLDCGHITEPIAVEIRNEQGPVSAPERWVSISGIGGFVCAVPDPAGPDGICGMPVEDEPCDRHTVGKVAR